MTEIQELTGKQLTQLHDPRTLPHIRHRTMALQCCVKCAKHKADDEILNEHGKVLKTCRACLDQRNKNRNRERMVERKDKMQQSVQLSVNNQPPSKQQPETNNSQSSFGKWKLEKTTETDEQATAHDVDGLLEAAEGLGTLSEVRSCCVLRIN